jgi:ribonuclease R
VTEILGHPDDFGVDVEMMIRKHQLPRVFPEAVLAEARAVAHLDRSEAARRRDFRALPIVTIDGETARDFDDAVLVEERADGGWSLQVHIADVAQYVRPGTALDLEARFRGTSVYFPDRAIPMLPHELSSEICSLKPGEDRLVLSCLMELTPEGRIESYEIVEGLIRSAARMTYTEVHAILEGDAAARARYAALVPAFERMQRLAMRMNQRRQQRGSIDFDLPEPVIEFDQHGQMRGVIRAERTWANRLIEEFMLAANECVATWLEDLGVPSIYRIHERPEPRRVVQFEEIAAGFGVSLGLGALPVKRVITRGDRRQAQRSGRAARAHEVAEEIAVTPRMYQKLTKKIEGSPMERILSYLMLRSLKQARYSEENRGHFALATGAYTHFTSPIRRYPDLIFHRILKHVLLDDPEYVDNDIAVGAGEPTKEQRFWQPPWKEDGKRGHAKKHAEDRAPLPGPIDEPALREIAEQCSMTERRSDDAERELLEWKKVKFMEDRIGEEFAGMIVSATKFGLFVELNDLFIEGLIPIGTLIDDRYVYHENTRQIIGERSKRTFSMGDQVRVILDRVDPIQRRIQFALAEELPQRKSRGRRRSRL